MLYFTIYGYSGLDGGFEPEIVHCHELWATPASWLLSRLTGAKFVYDIWEPDFFMESNSKIHRLLMKWQRWAVRRADVVIITARRLSSANRSHWQCT